MAKEGEVMIDIQYTEGSDEHESKRRQLALAQENAILREQLAELEAFTSAQYSYDKYKEMEQQLAEAQEHEQKLYDRQVAKSNQIEELREWYFEECKQKDEAYLILQDMEDDLKEARDYAQRYYDRWQEFRKSHREVLEQNAILANAKSVLLQEISGKDNVYIGYLERELKEAQQRIGDLESTMLLAYDVNSGALDRIAARDKRIAELEGEIYWHNKYVKKIHRAI